MIVHAVVSFNNLRGCSLCILIYYKGFFLWMVLVCQGSIYHPFIMIECLKPRSLFRGLFRFFVV